MKFIADFHIHSHFSIATSSQLCPEYLDHWGRIKGIRVIGTGDFTHPGWTRELRDKLNPAEPGLYRLKPGLQVRDPWGVPETPDNAVRFMLTAEISSIYKRGGKVRKVHNVLFAPDFETAERIQARLADLDFNITSDGRPILGLDSRDLFELVLDVSERTFLLPAHIWTPWFSALGAKSGFDSIEACYGDLAHRISAVETGLSSDPPMNWLCSGLDGYTLLSNSDAHSPEKLGREANLFDTDLSYDAVIEAVESGDPHRFLGTVEFFPQEGKYHHDGHRKCGVHWPPSETSKHGGLCPVCGKPVVVGVLNRVMQLADRDNPEGRPNRRPFHSLIPLKELLSEIHSVGPSSKQVARDYTALLEKLGPELNVLLFAPEEELKRVGRPVLAEAVRRMRAGEVRITAGYDGEYGVIRAFDESEVRRLQQVSLFQESGRRPQSGRKEEYAPTEKLEQKSRSPKREEKPSKKEILNPQQLKAVRHFTGPALVIAGPGTGKTRVLTRRIAFLIQERGVWPGHILAVTFTNKAAEEMRARLQSLISDRKTLDGLTVSTFHAFGHAVLKEHASFFGRDSRFAVADEEDRAALLREAGCDTSEIGGVSERLSEIKQSLIPTADIGDSRTALFFEKYEGRLRDYNLFDLDDLIAKPVELLHHHPDVRRDCQGRFQWILVDEYQDINFAQHQMLQALMSRPNANLFAIGDPDQAIYGFRGADVHFIRGFALDHPDAAAYRLSRSYRCPNTILRASSNVLDRDMTAELLSGMEQGLKVRISRQPTDRSEAEFIARAIESMMGGLRFFSMDSDIATGHEQSDLSLSDFAVLCRTSSLMEPLKKAFQDHSIPIQTVEETSFLKRNPARSVIARLKAAAYPNRFFRKAVGGTVQLNAKSDAPVNALIRAVLHGLGAKESDPDIRRLLVLAADFENDLIGFLKWAVLGSPVDAHRPRIEAVSLLTMHASKGLEFECVIVPGCEDGLIPYSLFGKESDPAEERRLLYVAMTRAKTHLILTHVQKRFLRGKEFNLARSPFLETIESALVKHDRVERKRRKTEKQQLGLFE